MSVDNPSAVREKFIAEETPRSRDLLLDIIGHFGRFQLFWCCLTGLSVLIHGWQMLSNKFYTHRVDFWCARPVELQNIRFVLTVVFYNAECVSLR